MSGQIEEVARSRWRVQIGATDAKIFLWSDENGPVDLTTVSSIELFVEWEGGGFNLQVGDEASGLWRLDQTIRATKGMFAVRLPRTLREKLPRGWPASWAVWVTRYGQRRKRWTGWMYGIVGSGQNV